MTHEFMTTEGDRSGVETPSKRDKARERLRAAVIRLASLLARWDDASLSDCDRALEMSAALDSLEAFSMLMMGESPPGDGDTP